VKYQKRRVQTPLSIIHTFCAVGILNCGMETSHFARVSKNHCVTAPDRILRGSNGKESSATLIEEPRLQESLRRIIANVSGDPALEEDLMQESLVHLWKVECDNPGHTRSWYLQSCRFHVQHWLAAGRSLDSPKRAQADKRIVIDEDDSDSALPKYRTNGEVFEEVSFRDVVSILAKHLKPRERIVLRGLAEGFSTCEIAFRFGISFPTVLKARRKIAALTVRLGISPPLRALQQN
jgi:DNA-directed RNA polymerase specialized sigma24 family protein